MPGLDIPHGGRVLGQGVQVAVSEMRIIEPASLEFQAGGCDRPTADIKAVLIDVPKGTLYFVPIGIGYAEKLHKQLGELITEHNRKAIEG